VAKRIKALVFDFDLDALLARVDAQRR